jgi:UDP-N-acetylglucosamine acyltransferase
VFWPTRKSAPFDLQYDRVSIHPTAEIGQDVEIGPFTFIGPNCRIADGCRIHNNASIIANTVIGPGSDVFPGAVIGAVPQDKKYRGEDCWVIIGHSNTIRECVTIHGGTEGGGRVTRVGHRNLLMAGCHIAHDCLVEDDVILANNVLLGGHVHVERGANLGGLAAVHHFVTIGQYAFVAGTSRVNQDVPPFCLWQGEEIRTINKIGLKRHGIPDRALDALKRAHRILFRDGLPRTEALARVVAELGHIEEIAVLVQSIRHSQRGHQGRARQPDEVRL